MKKTLNLLSLFPTIFFPTTLFAQDLTVQQDLSSSQDLVSQIEARQNAFEKIEILSKQASNLLNGNESDWQALEQVGKELTRNSAQLHVAFPVGSQENSKAKQEVWSKPDNFNHLMVEMDNGFIELYRGVQAQNAPEAEQGLEKAQDTCRSCHRAYRSRW